MSLKIQPIYSAAKLQRAILLSGMRQHDAATKMGISPTVLSFYLNGHRNKFQKRIAGAIDRFCRIHLTKGVKK